MSVREQTAQEWIEGRIDRAEVRRYMEGGRHFIDGAAIGRALERSGTPDAEKIREILAKSMEIETLSLDETAALLHVGDPALMEEMRECALRVKLKVYDNRIVTFAPLYTGNRCVNDCLYCGFRCGNASAERRVLSMDEIRREAGILAGDIGHKRLIAVYGEHPETGVDYIVDSLKAIYGVRVKARHGYGQIRRVNVNAAPMRIDELKRIREAGIGTYQVFQETYHEETYRRLHPRHTLKADYLWRLYAMHRAFEAGIDDVGIGALFGLYDWRFEVLALVSHARELERRFGIGPHTVSFPRLEPAGGAPYSTDSPYLVGDDDFRHLMVAIRLAIPYAGMIITARESAGMRHSAFRYGCTQTDASSRIGVGGYSEGPGEQEGRRQQFILGDTRSLDEVIRDYADMDCITSFCTAGYRCGRTGECIMTLLKKGEEGVFCKLNAILTYREWLDDFASPETREAGERVVTRELKEVGERYPKLYPKLLAKYERVRQGERDLWF